MPMHWYHVSRYTAGSMWLISLFWYFEDLRQELLGKETVVDDGWTKVRLNSLEMIAYNSLQW